MRPGPGGPAAYEANADGADFVFGESEFLRFNLLPELYDLRTPMALLPQFGRFRFVIGCYHSCDQ